MKQHNLICNICNQPFTSARVTSKECRKCNKNKNKSPRKYIDSICQQCGNVFSHRSDHDNKYCSSKCFGESIKVNKDTICKCCGITFEYRRKGQKYCSDKCQKSAPRVGVTKSVITQCFTCNKDIVLKPHQIRDHNFCSKQCQNVWKGTKTGESSSQWRGGIYMTNQGYRFLRQPDGTYKAEHRIVMEEKIGRELLSDEVVHHIDEDKLNNDINNLQLMTRSEHIEEHRNALYMSVHGKPRIPASIVETLENKEAM